jgi:hypothetical protein
MNLHKAIASRPARELLVLVACWFVFAIGSPAQRANTAGQSSLAGPYRIAGVLVNAGTSAPVPRANIEVLTEEDSHAVASCITDSEGRFALEHLAAAKYQLTASKRGFRTAAYDEHDEFSSAIVTGPDQDTTHLKFRLMPKAVLRGTVTNDAGEPVTSARVLLYRQPKHPATGDRITEVAGTETDDTGAYEFGNLAAGEYLLAVMAEPWYATHDMAGSKGNPALDVAYPVTYFDSTTNESSATPIALAGGAREEANISLHAVPALHISASVSHGANGPFVSFGLHQIVFGNIAPPSGINIRGVDSETVQVSGIAPGRYEFEHGSPPHISDLDLASSQQLDPNAGTPANALEGRVRTISGIPVPEQVTITLERMDSGPGQNQYATEAHNGQFRFDAVPPGQWAVWATSGDKALPVMAVSAGGRLHAGNLVTLRDRIPELMVILSATNTRVAGLAQKDGKGFAGAMIVLLPKNLAQWKALTRRDQSDSDGSFTLRDVAPGQYTLIAIADGWPLDWTSPARMARYLPAGTNVTVTDTSGKLVQVGSPVVVQER